MTINIIVLIAMTLAALWTVLSRSLMRSAIGLLITSTILTIFIFRLDCPLAAVFELSVCAGLIPVLFISGISLSQPRTPEEVEVYEKERWGRFRYLLYIVIIAAIIMSIIKIHIPLNLPPKEMVKDVRTFIV